MYATGQGSRIGNSRAHRTVARILEAGRTVFARDGFAAAEVTAIVEEAGTSRTTFYTYFASKEELLREIIMARLPDLLRSGPRLSDPSLNSMTPRERIHAANLAYLDAYREHADIMRIWAEAAAQDPIVLDLLQEARQPFLLRTANSIRQLQRQGLADPDLDPDYSAYALTGMVSAFAHAWLVEGKEWEADKSAQTLTALWANALGLPAESGVSSTT